MSNHTRILWNGVPSSYSTTGSRSWLREGLTGLETVFKEHFLEYKRIQYPLRLGQHLDDSGNLPSGRFLPSHFARVPAPAPCSFWSELEADWRECLANYGLSLASAQTAKRLVYASRRSDSEVLCLFSLTFSSSRSPRPKGTFSFSFEPELPLKAALVEETAHSLFGGFSQLS